MDNVLERFVEMSRGEGLLEDDQILRVATDFSKVDEGLRIQQLSGGQKSLVALATGMC